LRNFSANFRNLRKFAVALRQNLSNLVKGADFSLLAFPRGSRTRRFVLQVVSAGRLGQIRGALMTDRLPLVEIAEPEILLSIVLKATHIATAGQNLVAPGADLGQRDVIIAKGMFFEHCRAGRQDASHPRGWCQ